MGVFLFRYETNKIFIIQLCILKEYDFIRVFHYNLKKQRLIEFNKKGNILKKYSCKDTPELYTILRNI